MIKCKASSEHYLISCLLQLLRNIYDFDVDIISITILAYDSTDTAQEEIWFIANLKSRAH